MKANTVKIVSPSDIKDALTTSESLAVLLRKSMEVEAAISDTERRLAELRGHRADFKKEYAAMKPKILGVLKPLQAD